jgi:NAD(P)-dependent dehydrogenase (short-subunit alcohol dehydrogenase family)
MDGFSKKTAVVTGAGSGIGRALALAFAAEGASVVAADVEAGALDETAALIRDAGGTVTTSVTDVSDEAQVEALAELAYDEYGAVHVLCNNAGVFQAGLMWERTPADFAWVLGVNLWGVLYGIRAFVPRMIAQGGEAHIVNTSSMAGLMTGAFSGPYHVSKFGVTAATEALAHDLNRTNPQIKVSLLCPGAVDTRIADSTRNRPDDAGDMPDHQLVADALVDLTTSRGRPPAEVAELVLDAIRTERFLILTSEHTAAMARDRIDALLEGNLPGPPEFA